MKSHGPQDFSLPIVISYFFLVFSNYSESMTALLTFVCHPSFSTQNEWWMTAPVISVCHLEVKEKLY